LGSEVGTAAVFADVSLVLCSNRRASAELSITLWFYAEHKNRLHSMAPFWCDFFRCAPCWCNPRVAWANGVGAYGSRRTAPPMTPKQARSGLG